MTALQATYLAIRDGRPRKLHEITPIVIGLYGKTMTDTNVAARLRDLRKAKFGGHTITCKNDVYQFVAPKPKQRSLTF